MAMRAQPGNIWMGEGDVARGMGDAKGLRASAHGRQARLARFGDFPQAQSHNRSPSEQSSLSLSRHSSGAVPCPDAGSYSVVKTSCGTPPSLTSLNDSPPKSRQPLIVELSMLIRSRPSVPLRTLPEAALNN